MKKLIFSVAIVAVAAFSASAQSSEYPMASIDNHALVLPSGDLEDTYMVDIDHSDFQDVDQLESFFHNFNDDYITYKVDRSSGEVMAYVNPVVIESGKSIDEVNKHLDNLRDKMKNEYMKMKEQDESKREMKEDMKEEAE